MKTLRIILIVLILVAGSALNLVQVPVAKADTASGNAFTVCGLGCDHSTIQDAVDAASDGDVIIVGPGIFNENVVVDKSLIITAMDGVSPIIDGDTNVDTTPDGDTVTIAADQVIINGFEIRNGYNGIAGETSQSGITNNIIHDNLDITGSAGVGILLWGDNNENVIQGNAIFHNERQGIRLGYSNDSKISDANLITHNGIYSNGSLGIQLWHADASIIEHNEIFGHNGEFSGHGIYLVASNGNAISDNDIHDNNIGVSLDVGSADNYLVGNVIHDHAMKGLAVFDEASTSTLANFNQFCRNKLYGVINLGDGNRTPDVDATYNWWGSASGPGGAGPGTGDNVSEGVSFWPWDDVPPTDGPCHINSIHVQKYKDLDGSGDKSDDEGGLNGWWITLYDAEGQEVMHDTTHTIGGEDGWVLFEDLPAGTYTVCETLKGGWVSTDPGTDSPCKSVTVIDTGRGPGSGPLFTIVDHPGDDAFRSWYLGIDFWGLDVANLNEDALRDRLSEPWLCLLDKLVPLDPSVELEPDFIDPRWLIQWDIAHGFDNGLFPVIVESDYFEGGQTELYVKTWRGRGGYSTATGFVAGCGGAQTVLFGNQPPATAITLASFTAEPGVGSVTLAWETGTEVDNAGFNLYRATASEGPYTKINDALIAAEGDPVSGASYSLVDVGVSAGTCYYKLEDVDYYGVATLHGPASVTVMPRFRRPAFRPTVP